MIKEKGLIYNRAFSVGERKEEFVCFCVYHLTCLCRCCLSVCLFQGVCVCSVTVHHLSLSWRQQSLSLSLSLSVCLSFICYLVFRLLRYITKWAMFLALLVNAALFLVCSNMVIKLLFTFHLLKIGRAFFWYFTWLLQHWYHIFSLLSMLHGRVVCARTWQSLGPEFESCPRKVEKFGNLWIVDKNENSACQ